MNMGQGAETQARYRAKILCIDPEPRVPEWFPATLRQAGYLVQTLDSSKALGDPARVQEFDLIILDLNVPGQDGLGLLKGLAQPRSSPPVIVIAEQQTILREEELIQAGAHDIVFKPVSPVVLGHVLERTLNQSIMRRELDYLRSQWARPLPGKSIGISGGWSRVLATIERAAASDAPVLILGETGLGKGDAARLLHSLSPRSRGPFVRVDCARLSRNRFAGEDPAHQARAEEESEQYIHLADAGTLFMEEIGALPEAVQTRILELLEEQPAEPGGEKPPGYANVRFVASSTLDLEAEAAAGRFNRALLHRLNAAPIIIPPLRQRVEDIPLLAAAFLERSAARMHKNVSSFNPEAMRLLESYSWPGNVSELRNVIERAVLLTDSSEITASCLPLEARPAYDPNRPLNLREVLAAEEKRTLKEALVRSHGVRREAARLLGIDPRNLVYFLRKYGLDKKEGQG